MKSIATTDPARAGAFGHARFLPQNSPGGRQAARDLLPEGQMHRNQYLVMAWEAFWMTGFFATVLIALPLLLES
ncbi:hypothetical protein GCM10011317_48040 [Niveispirillum cyanobacteriorum]|nr:hypothetical protein GCM10011317_48040 [Niveispirillum cyanobacteriorum]